MKNKANNLKDAVSEVCWDLDKQVPDFAAKVAPLFQANGWTWAMIAKDDGPPNAENIKSCLYMLISEVRKEGRPTCCSTGRLQVRVAQYENRVIGELELVPEHNRSNTFYIES